MYKKLTLLLLILVLSGGHVVAAGNDSSYVSDIIHVEGDDFNSVDNVVDTCKDNDVIELNGTYAQNHWRILIDKSITLQGCEDGATLDMTSGDNHAVYVENSDVTFNNLKFYNSSWSNNMICVLNSNLTIINCTFENIGYFALDFNGNSLKIDDCKFINSKFGSIFSDSGNAMIKNSIFQNIEEEGINFQGESLDVENCNFVDVLHTPISAQCSEVNINRNQFKNVKTGESTVRIISNKSSVKRSTFYKGVSLVVTGVSEILNCDFTKSYIAVSNSLKANIKNSIFKKNSYIFSLNNIKNVNIINNTFEGNCLEGGYSISNIKVINNTVGGNFVKMDSTLVLDKVTIKNSQFSNNTFGNNIFVLSPEKSIAINSNVFSNNYCPAILNIAFDSTSTVQITNNIFSNNLDKNGKLAQIRIDRARYYYTDSKGATLVKFTTKTLIGNNFLGFNIVNKWEIEFIPQIQFHNASWINMDFKQVSQDNGMYKYSLSFIDTSGKIFKLPAYNFKIKDKSGNVLADNIQLKDGTATFDFNRLLSLKDIFIVTDGGGIVNRPKADITITRVGSHYDNTKVTVILSYGDYLKNEIVRYDVHEYESAKSKIVRNYVHKTNSNGISTLGPVLNCFYKYFDIVAMHSSKDFAYVSATLKNVKVAVSSVKITASKMVTTYKSGKLWNIKVVNSKNQPVKGCLLSVQVISKDGILHDSCMSQANGWAHTSLSTYPKLGTFKVIITDGDGNHKMKAIKTTLTIKKAKTMVSVPKSVKKSSIIKIVIKNKATKKPNAGIKVKVKVFTGKSFKVFNLKTNSKGIVAINAKKFALGSHKITIGSNDKRYGVSAKSKINIIK